MGVVSNMRKFLTYILILFSNFFVFSQNENNECLSFDDMKIISEDDKTEIIEEVRNILNPEKKEIRTIYCPPMTLSFNTGCSFPYNYENIKFSLGVLLVESESKLILESNADIETIKKNPNINLRRAKEVKKIFEHYGIESNRIEIVDYGNERPIASNKTEQGRKENNYIYLKIKR